jgi:hypothetical protein
MENSSNKVLLVFDDENYKKLLKMIEDQQKIRDRAYKVWQESHENESSKTRKRKQPLQFQMLGKV